MSPLLNSKTFEGKVAVVTGGNSGIGLATATLLHRQGAKVIISGNELWEFDDAGLMRRRIASINDAKIVESDRRVH